MKKVIQIVSFIALVFVMSGVSVNAQSSTRIDAVIPYDFTIGNRQFDAGKYVMRVKRHQNGVNLVELRDSRYRVVYEGFALENGENTNGKANLLFDRAGSVAKLTEIRTGERGYSISAPTDNDRVNIASKKKKKERETKN